MKKRIFYLIILFLTACSSSKTYFTASIRNSIEKSNQNMSKVQFYVDRDIVLRRELQTGETKITSGKVTIENGKNINIVTLKKNTPGVCILPTKDVVGISFESDNSTKFLNFGKTKFAEPNDPYRILANYWKGDEGVIIYEGKEYHILPKGTEASILIKSKFLKKINTEDRKMGGRTIS